jgi:hypothetical protein
LHKLSIPLEPPDEKKKEIRIREKERKKEEKRRKKEDPALQNLCRRGSRRCT